MSFIALVDRKPAHLKLFEDTPDAGTADMDIVIAFEIDHDFPGSKMIGLPQIDDFREYFGIRGPGTKAPPSLNALSLPKKALGVNRVCQF